MLPVARTRDEAHLYMDLHGCPQCSNVDVDWAEALVDEGGVTGRRYHGVCPGCGARREFVFALPERPTPPRPGETDAGRAERDRDPGRFLRESLVRYRADLAGRR